MTTRKSDPDDARSVPITSPGDPGTPPRTSTRSKSRGMAVPGVLVSPSHATVIVPRRDVRTGADGTGGGVVSSSMVTVTAEENSEATPPADIACTRNCHDEPTSNGDVETVVASEVSSERHAPAETAGRPHRT